MRLHSKDITGIGKTTLFFVVPLVVLFLVIFSFYEKSLEQQASLLLQTEQEKGCAIITTQLEAVFSQFVSDLLLVFDSAEFSRYVEDSGQYNRTELEQLFLRIANKKDYINHIRLLDASGMEVIKVAHFPNTSAALSGPSSLIDRSDTELFAFGQSHDANTMYISPIGLESRQSFEDAHIGPAMILALPAYDKKGEFFGLVIVDYDACFLLSFLRDYQTTMTKDIIFGLVANNGEWIHRGGQPCSEFIYEGQDEPSLFLEAPELESHIFSGDSGLYVSAEKSYEYQAVMPKATQNLSWYPDTGRLWTVVSYYNLVGLPELSQNLLLLQPALKWWIASLIFLAGLIVVFFLQLRMADQLQLQVSSLISEYSGNGIVIVDEKQYITFCNHAFEVLCGYSQDELIGKSTQKFLLCDNTPHERIIRRSGVPISRPVWVHHRNGNQFLTNRTQTSAKTKSRTKAYSVEVYSNSAWKVSEFVDYVGEYQVELPQFLLTECAEKDGTCYCLLINLKHHTSSNSHYSLVEESEFSIALSHFIASVLGKDEPVYAFSADTYALLFFDDGKVLLKKRVDILLKGIEQHCANNLKFEHVQAMCGVSQYSGEDMSIQTLLIQASMAIKMVEDIQKCNCLFFDANVHNQYLRKQAILAAIPEAFKSSSLKLYYQPLVDVASGKILGAEALIRWTHPELGFIAPDEFIPLMEKHHMIALLGEFVIRTAIGFLKTNQDFILRIEPNFSLAINLSPEEFANPSIIDLIGNELQQQGVDPSLLSIELTERTAVESLQTTGKLMERLHQIGVGISIDDFGTGFSSLSYLLEFSIDKLKIDRSFIANYPDSDAIAIYKTVLMLAKELDITVVAEGVETEEQLQFLKEVVCNQYQGFLFSKAVPESEFLKQLGRVSNPY